MTMFPVLFAIPRTSGWISQWEELLLDPEQKIARPRQIYLGHDTRHLRANRPTQLNPTLHLCRDTLDTAACKRLDNFVCPGIVESRDRNVSGQ